MRVPLNFVTAILFILMAGLFLSSCRPEATKELGDPPTAAFTITPVAGKVNTYALASTSQNAWGYAWNKGNGNFVKGNELDTVYFPLRGTYTVQLRAFGNGGSDVADQSVTIDVDDIQNNVQFQLLTAHGWKLDPADGANAIIVGTEGNPGQYFGGGGLADCQKDDVYTFTSDFKLNYNANGSTFNAGNLSPNYSCSGDRSYSNFAYSFTPGTTAGAGLATISLSASVPDKFIGVTDISSNNYRIISINATTMVLRSGTASETVHQFKFVAI